MRFRETKLKGAHLVEPERFEDDRGFFARTFCRQEFEANQLESAIAQCSLSFNKKKGTLRGMHYQAPPFEETKLIRCIGGSIWDVILDLRPDSPTFKQHYSICLSADNRISLYVPKGFAHGFQTMEDETEVFYQMSEFYAPEHARGIRWNDPAFSIRWPLSVSMILDRDRSYPDFGS